MLQLLPFIAWVAAVVSAVLLFVLWSSEDLSARSLRVLFALFVVALLCQVYGRSDVLVLGGLCLQTMLAVYLIIRWKLAT